MDKKQIGAQAYALKYFSKSEELVKLKEAWLDGFEANVKKWNNIENPPDNDKEVLIYVRDHKTPWHSRNHFGSYINEKWYLKGGIEPHYELVKWAEITEDKEELKTQQEWKEIFNKFIILDYDGFEDFNSDEKITEWQYVCRLAHSTTSL